MSRHVRICGKSRWYKIRERRKRERDNQTSPSQQIIILVCNIVQPLSSGGFGGSKLSKGLMFANWQFSFVCLIRISMITIMACGTYIKYYILLNITVANIDLSFCEKIFQSFDCLTPFNLSLRRKVRYMKYLSGCLILDYLSSENFITTLCRTDHFVTFLYRTIKWNFGLN